MRFMRALRLVLVALQYFRLAHAKEHSICCGGRVAIVGAGIGGSASAFYLHERNITDIDIFEGHKVGGRTTAIDVDGKVVEMGASIIHNQNRHFKSLAESFNLKLIEPGADGPDRLFSIYDGQQVVFKQSSWDMLTLGKMIWRYGLSYFQFKRAPAAMLRKFLQIYDAQNEGKPFKTPEEMLLMMGLYNLTQGSMRQEVQRILGEGVRAQRFGREFIGGINHVNYNQNNSLNAMAGMVSMLPTVDSNVFAVKGGNFQLAEQLLQASNASLHLPVKIRSIKKGPSGYHVTSKSGQHGPYASVIIATPLEDSGLTLDIPNLPIVPPRKYQRTVTTLVNGLLKGAYFGASNPPAGDYILVAEGSQMPFSVISPLVQYVNKTMLYKVFSAEPLSEELLEALFTDRKIVAQHDWQAYPRFSPPETFAPFELAEGLHYNNAIETAASAMEMSLIAAKNSALLTANFLADGNCEMEDITVV